jgi:hypothetical protein
MQRVQQMYWNVENLLENRIVISEYLQRRDRPLK